jgi:hypothetical protein
MSHLKSEKHRRVKLDIGPTTRKKHALHYYYTAPLSEQPLFSDIVKNFKHLMGATDSLLYSPAPASSPYCKPN